MTKRKLGVQAEVLRFVEPFRIAGYVFETSEVVVVTLEEGDHQGRGEGGGVYYLGDDVPNMLADIAAAKDAIEAGASREALLALMPAGGGRNAVDAALWELESRQAGVPVWRLAGLESVRPVVTTFTVSAGEPEWMAGVATRYAEARSIKVKLTGELALDLERVRAIRAARPDVWLGVDGNQGYLREDLEALVAGLCEFDVALLEQPLKRGAEAGLERFKSPIPIAGDESLLTLDDVATAVGRFDVVNIKLDKCGGLTEGLRMAEAARRLGLGVMVGTMVGTSLATAPGFVLGQLADLVDLDGPTFLAEDRKPSVVYRDGTLFAGDDVWGGAQTVAA
ncbi:dipeptide epimerase [Sphingomonas sp.]|uniref:dipeptide epimerase n=1 Tax=Sphingomonas sp. TaxID=28214 RepID=UPI001B2A93CC|nr:dipeptide epimerase [Sphingomonas sp.]MBO9711619.1 dipeptide epimerase [Sphingomonas sp.]